MFGRSLQAIQFKAYFNLFCKAQFKQNISIWYYLACFLLMEWGSALRYQEHHHRHTHYLNCFHVIQAKVANFMKDFKAMNEQSEFSICVHEVTT